MLRDRYLARIMGIPGGCQIPISEHDFFISEPWNYVGVQLSSRSSLARLQKKNGFELYVP